MLVPFERRTLTHIRVEDLAAVNIACSLGTPRGEITGKILVGCEKKATNRFTQICHRARERYFTPSNKSLSGKPVAMVEVFRSMSELNGTRYLSGL